MNNIIRLCFECRTTDASFPLKKDCKSCATMLSPAEYNFWNNPPNVEEEYIPDTILHSTIQTFKAFFDLITLG